MGLQRIPFAELAPDLPPLGSPYLLRANNCTPIQGGYGPLQALQDVGETVLSLRCRGAIAGVDVDGNSYNFAGDETKLYALDSSGSRDVSKTAGYNCRDKERWTFAIFNNDVFGCNLNDPFQFRSLTAAPLDLFADVVDLDDKVAAPRSRHMAIVGRHLVLGNVYDGRYGNGLMTDAVWWPAIDNPHTWPEPGSDDSHLLQSDFQRLRGDGGWIQGVVSGSEVGAVFQERSVWRMDYVGGDVQFEFTRVEPNRGLLVPHLACAFGRVIFFLSEEGFRLFDYTSSQEIGKDRIDNFFLGDLDFPNADRVTCVQHPDETLIVVGYPGAGNIGGTPNKLLLYDWSINRFATGDQAHEILTRVLPKHLHMDNLDATVPDLDAADDSLDDRLTAFGGFALGGYTTAHGLGIFDGDVLEAVFETSDLELSPGTRSQVRAVRPLVKGGDGRVEVARLGRSNEAVVYGPSAKTLPSGRCAVRANGRYHRMRYTLPAKSTFTLAEGLDVEFTAAGGRR